MANDQTVPVRRKRNVTNFVRSTMKSFLSRKKTPTEPLSATEEAYQALSSPPPPPISPGVKKSASRWKRSKKQVEVAPEVNLAAVLPPTDDFRTSLLMPTFAARFSMLREQDDPNSLLGKASDDSVLQPRRRSRMDFGGLGDIAEVSSIRSQVRPPFAYGRQDSFASEDGYASENDSHNGSVLSRARPGEGNTMFGGRQKVYMIPKASASSSRSLGKVRYEDDIGMSAFQRYKRELEQQAVQARTSEEGHSFDFGLDRIEPGEDYPGHATTPNDSAKDLSHSPSLSSNEKKRSTSSTSPSEARSSTIATSVTSQPASSVPVSSAQPSATPQVAPPLKRADTKTRRLYEQGLDQHMYDQQASAMTRLNSIHRQRGVKQAPPVLYSTRSTGNLHEKARQPVYAVRPQSPEAMLNNFGSIRRQASNTSSPNLSGPVSPMTPHDLDGDGSMALTQALEPGDRGKATAMGAFNKPKQSFDENQYLERQRQLQRSASNAAVKKQVATPSAVAQRMDRFDFEREHSDSDASARSRSRPRAPVPEVPNAYNVFQRAAQMNTAPGAQQFDKTTLPDTHRTFFGNISASDSEDEDDSMSRSTQQPYAQQDYGYSGHHGRWQPTALPSVSEHPALRRYKSKASLAEEDEDLEFLGVDTSQSASFRLPEHPVVSNTDPDIDSPTLGPGAGSTPLTGMMHHLRQQSNVSSITQGEEKHSLDASEVPDVPDWNPKNLDLIHHPIQPTLDSDSRISTYTSSNPFDLEERDNPSRLGERASRASISPIDGQRSFGNFDSRAPSRSTFMNRQSAVSQLTPEGEGEEEGSWQNELQRQHTRDASNATQQERDAFQGELEARRIAAQEKIAQAISKSRSASPAPSATGGPGFRGFGMLRSRPSRESVTDNGQRTQAPPKAMKMLGLSGGSGNASSTTLNSQYERGGYSLDIGRQRDISATRPPLPDNPPRALQQHDQYARREWQQGRSRENSESRPMVRPQSGLSPVSSAGGRSRANSEAAGGRSRSRTGPYRDDLEKAMVEGTGSSAASPMIPHEFTPRPSPDVVQGSFEQTRARSNSRPQMTGYFDSNGLQPLQTGSRERLSPGVGPPVTLSPNVYSPGPASARGVPPSPFASNMTPPLSGANTPVSSTFTPGQAPPSSGSSGRPNIPLRKKTISKGDISEPTLIMSTSNIDTVKLPVGASLKNGMEEAPPLPPINPRRRATKAIFGLGQRKESDDITPTFGARSKTPDPWVGNRPAEPDYSFEPPGLVNRSGSETRSPRVPATKQSYDQSPSMRQNGFAPTNGSPERMGRPPVPPQPVGYEGGMF